MNIACFDCGAGPGDRCITRTGQPARRPHAFRRDDDQDRVVSWRAAEIAASIRMLTDIGFIPVGAERVAAYLDNVAAHARPTEQDRATVLRLAEVDNRGRPTMGGDFRLDDILSHRRRFGDELAAIGATLRRHR